VKYKIPKPRECLSCGGTCYAYGIYDTNTTGQVYPKSVYKCYWTCNRCSRTFETMERESDFIEVDRLPEDYAPYKGIARVEVE